MSAAGRLLCEKYRCRMHAPPTTEESWSYGRSLLTAKYKEQTNKLKYQNLLKSTRKERNFEFPNSDQKKAMQSTSCTAANHEQKGLRSSHRGETGDKAYLFRSQFTSAPHDSAVHDAYGQKE